MNTVLRKKPITSSDEIIQAAVELARQGEKKMVAVAGASDTDVLDALSSAHSDGILTATLFGDREKIQTAADESNVDITPFEIVHCRDAEESARGAAKMADDGRADVIMKGFVSTSALLKMILSKDFRLRTKNTISHSAVLDIPGYHKLLQMTDGGMIVRPDVEQKIQIMENAVLVGRALGISPVKVALSGAVDRFYGDFDQDGDTKAVLDRIISLKLRDVLVQGPLTFDAATSKEIAGIKGVEGPVVGDADIYLVSSIEECNIIAKSLINFADTVFAGVIVGAAVPVSLVSRTDTAQNKKASVSIACLVAEYYKSTGFWEKRGNP
jgi:phosphate butyryltransferase